MIDLDNLENYGESDQLEVKAAQNGLPMDMWKTC